MKICGIVAEYNPFHNGHLYQIQKAREITGCDRIVVIMSGDFVQRGIPAIADKYSRTKAALLCGADLVVELPVIYATSSVKMFAAGSVYILDALGCDYICFGSENGEIEVLKDLSIAYRHIEENCLAELKELVRSGKSYPKALASLIKYKTDADVEKILSNDRLGMAYLNAIDEYGLKLVPYTVKREGNYLDDNLNSGSALSIRNEIRKSESLNKAKTLIPDLAFKAVFDEDFHPVFEDDFSDMLYARIMTVLEESYETDNTDNIADARARLTKYYDVSDNIASKIISGINTFKSFSAFAEHVHSSEYTMSRVYRSLLHILLNIKTDDVQSPSDDCYARILGINRDNSDLLTEIKKRSRIKVISKAADADMILTKKQYANFVRDINAADFYEYIICKKKNTDRVSEFSKGNVYINRS